MSTVFSPEEPVLLNVVRLSNPAKINLGLAIALFCVLAPQLVWRHVTTPTPAPQSNATSAQHKSRPTVEQSPPILKFQDLAPNTAAAINAAMPISTLPNPAARPFTLKAASAQDRNRAIDCLTQAVYYEAASEEPEGQRAVAQVVINRLRNAAFPKTVCGVVFQGAAQGMATKSGCQFSFACDGSRARQPVSWAWQRAELVARNALNGAVMPTVGNATHYHTVWVAPYWSPSLAKIGQIGAHIFYRWAGDAGLPTAFQGRYAGGEIAPQDMTPEAPPQETKLADAPEVASPVTLERPAVVAIKTAEASPVAIAIPLKDKSIDDALPTLQLTDYVAPVREQARPRSALPSGW